jgi:Na+/H+ antiporter NhaC
MVILIILLGICILVVLYFAFYSYPEAKEALEKTRDEKERDEIEQSISFIIRGIVFLSVYILIGIWALFLISMN